MTPRELARRYIESIFDSEWGGDDSLPEAIETLKPEDRAFFQELTQGTLREWHFLNWVISRHASRPPRGALKAVLNLSAYQLLFLDRVPDYAIFSEAAAMSSGVGVSEPELKFIHAVLKAVQRDKNKLLDIRRSSLERTREGHPPESDLEWAVLNVPSALLDALTIVDEKGKKKIARMRAVRAVAAMKERGRLIGFALPDVKMRSVTASLGSEVAPRALILKASPELSEDLESGALRVQGEASQWACETAARKLVSGTVEPIRILEMTAGKGGKLLGTLAAWTAMLGGRCDLIPAMEWIAADSSEGQLRFLEQDALPLVKKHWPQVKVGIVRTSWMSELPPEVTRARFDLVWLDAPCTGFGTLSKLPQIAFKRGPDAYGEALKLAVIQKNLVARVPQLLKPAGSFLYSVCTLTRPETLGIVEHYGQLAGRSPQLVGSLWPGSPPAPKAEGFFIALF